MQCLSDVRLFAMVVLLCVLRSLGHVYIFCVLLVFVCRCFMLVLFFAGRIVVIDVCLVSCCVWLLNLFFHLLVSSKPSIAFILFKASCSRLLCVLLVVCHALSFHARRVLVLETRQVLSPFGLMQHAPSSVSVLCAIQC